ncbi:MAG: hypothetical protein QOJ99_6122 [Bryobacterales bacterium]|jgi:hypothetical protein|nr:hypothetical protein [Bryobacterales bacterium]
MPASEASGFRMFRLFAGLFRSGAGNEGYAGKKGG